MRMIIVANGLIDDPGLIKARLSGWDSAAVIAADGGLKNALRLALPVQFLIGDFDSLSVEEIEGLTGSDTLIKRVSPEKDETDLELALLYALDQGAQELLILGAFGGRFDMTLANVLLLTHPALSDTRVHMWHQHDTAWLLRPPGGELIGEMGDTISLRPLNGDAEGVLTTDLQYPLGRERLAAGPARGVSNVISGSKPHVALEEGVLLVVHSPRERGVE